MKNMKKMGAIISCALLPFTQINSQQISSFNQDSIELGSTQRANQYSLLESTNLVDWSETQKLRGTESNLVFNINRDAPIKFFKTVSNHEPISPTNIYHWFQRGDRSLGTVTFNEQVINYSNNLNVNVTWTETYNDYGGGYTVNMPFTQTLTNGVNTVQTIFYTYMGTGQRMGGNVNLEVQQ